MKLTQQQQQAAWSIAIEHFEATAHITHNRRRHRATMERLWSDNRLTSMFGVFVAKLVIAVLGRLIANWIWKKINPTAEVPVGVFKLLEAN